MSGEQQAQPLPNILDGGGGPYSFDPLIHLLSFAFAACYFGIAAVKYYHSRAARRKTPAETPVKTGAVYFLLSGIMLLAFPLARDAMRGSLPPGPASAPPSFIVKSLLMSIVYGGLAASLAAPFFPWVMLLWRKNLRHLRVQGLTGLACAFIPAAYLIFFVLA